jgi:5-amino-6-(5-phosphoribosylamino)uracil reductase
MSHQPKPFVLMKGALSLDGFLDDTSSKRLILSHKEDMERVDLLKSTFDAVLVGAETVRKDNPSLLIKSQIYREMRLDKGLPENPLKVTLTNSGHLDPNSRFFQEGSQEKLVYCPKKIEDKLQKSLSHVATVQGLEGSEVSPLLLLEDLNQRGVSRLLIEGGAKINQLFLQHNLVNVLRLAIAPFFVGEKEAPRFVGQGSLPQNKDHRIKIKSVEMLGDMAILSYEIKKHEIFED